MKFFAYLAVGVLCMVGLATHGVTSVRASGNDALIQQLLQQLALLQAELRQLQGTGGFVFTRNLTVGDTGADVLELQKVLNQNVLTMVSVGGVGSPGQETTLFGGLTAAAVKRFQELYRNDILTPNGLTVGTGFVGTATRAKLNEVSRGGISPFLPVLPATTTPRISHGGGGGGSGGGSDPAPTLSLSVSPTSVMSGGTATLTWTSANATACTASGAWSGARQINGVFTTSALTTVGTQTFSLACTGTGGSVTRSVGVIVTPKTTPAPLAKCTVAFSPASVLAGATTRMQITTTNAVTAVMNEGIGQIATGTAVEMTVTPTETERYTLTVKNKDGVAATCSADMTVVPAFSRVGLGTVTNKQCTFPIVPALPKQTYYWFDQEYATINGESLRYDMAAPQVEGKYPLIILLHGGGFQGNGGVTKTSKFPEAEVRALAARGYVVATVEYSQATSSLTAPYGKNNFPEAIKDLRCAVQYFRSHSQPSLRFIDVGKIGVVGTSAGGHLALLLGTSADTTDFNDSDCPYNNLSARVQSVVALYPSARFRPEVLRYEWSNYKNVRTDNDSYIILGKQSNEVIDLIKKGSPLYALENYNTATKPYLPPMMIVNSGQERNPSLTTAVHYLVDTLRQKSIPHIFFTEYDAYHGFDPFNDFEKTSCFASSFLEQTLKR